jgi:A/G-specific adenine glycosylase
MGLKSKNDKGNNLRENRGLFQQRILDWYRVNARQLPWRAAFGERPNPYHEWLSEIMLQQTVVKAVIPYFLKFIELWPTIHDLAKASVDDVMRHWAGLGYYSRARNLHKCARMIADTYDGTLPEDYKTLISLAGIGPYTASAILSIAFNKPAIVIDGNIERVMTRLFADTTPIRNNKKILHDYASSLCADLEDHHGEYAQGLMELGATVCMPQNPKCTFCPVSFLCKSYHEKIQNSLPVKLKKMTKATRYGILYFIEDGMGNLLFEKRPSNGLLGGMVGIPGSEWSDSLDASLKLEDHFEVKHSFTHFDLVLFAFASGIEKINTASDWYFWYPLIDYDKIGLPSVYKKAVETYILTKNEKGLL